VTSGRISMCVRIDVTRQLTRYLFVQNGGLSLSHFLSTNGRVRYLGNNFLPRYTFIVLP